MLDFSLIIFLGELIMSKEVLLFWPGDYDVATLIRTENLQ